MARKKKQPIFEAHNRLHISQEDSLALMAVFVHANEYLGDKINSHAMMQFNDGIMTMTFNAIKTLEGKNNRKDTITNFNGIKFYATKENGCYQGEENTNKTMYSIKVEIPDATIKPYRKRKTSELKPSKETWQKENIKDLLFDFQNTMIEIKELLQGLD